jgi:uncharacterized phage protein (TIGR02218 family)
MKTASPELLALLATRQFYSADLYLFTLIGGGTLHYCGGDQDIVYNGITWSAGKGTGPYFDRQDNKAKCHWKVGVEVDTLVFDVLPGSSTVLGEAFLPAVKQGVFDGAELTLYRAFMPTYGNVAAGVVLMFAGRVAEVDAGRSLATFSVTSHLELLNQNMPRNLYQSGCVNTLFDASCGLSQPAFSVSGVVAAGSTASLVNTALPQASGYYALGALAFTTGANAGVSRTVKAWSGSQLTFFSPFPVAPATGDSFTITAGCDKTQATCSGKFNNLARFRGFPYVPENSTAV